jgi:hypothetical protein
MVKVKIAVLLLLTLVLLTAPGELASPWCFC